LLNTRLCRFERAKTQVGWAIGGRPEAAEACPFGHFNSSSSVNYGVCCINYFMMAIFAIVRMRFFGCYVH
jgi:hypothetical protein